MHSIDYSKIDKQKLSAREQLALTWFINISLVGVQRDMKEAWTASTATAVWDDETEAVKSLIGWILANRNDVKISFFTTRLEKNFLLTRSFMSKTKKTINLCSISEDELEEQLFLRKCEIVYQKKISPLYWTVIISSAPMLFMGVVASLVSDKIGNDSMYILILEVYMVAVVVITLLFDFVYLPRMSKKVIAQERKKSIVVKHR